MTKPAIDVEFRGPLFNNRKSGSIVNNATHNAITELVQLGEQRLDQVLRPRPMGVFLSVTEAGKGKASTGNYRRNVQGMVRELKGLITDGGMVYGPWLESGRAGTRFRGYASFRKVGDWLNTKAKDVLQNHVTKAVRQLRGMG